jgi:aspartyl-tRNA(Asn)/glutamyl-tRNA(Gln) amidotransferase subunit C
MNIKDVENLAELARLELSIEEKEAMLKDMDSILDYVKQVEKVEVSETNPIYNLKNVWREDKMEPREFSRELIVEQFPDSKGGFLKVKKIL